MGMAANYGMTRVKFIQSWQGYNAGDLAGFSQQVANNLVNEGVAAFDKVVKPAPTTVTKVQEPTVPVLAPKPRRKYGKGKTKRATDL